MPDKDYAELVKQAEEAVAPVKDPELKRIAFGKIFDALIGTHEGQDVAKASKKTRGGRSNRKKLVGKEKTAKKRSGTQAYVEELVDDDFFAKPKTIATVKAE